MEEKILHALENLNKRFDNLEARFDKFEAQVNKRFDSVEKRLDILESQTKENTDILKALMHSAEVNKAEHDKMMIDIAHVQGDVAAVKKDLSTLELVTANNYADLARLKAVK